MSVGDVKGFRRRLKMLRHLGHLPKPSSQSVAESVAKERAYAAKLAAKGKKKK